MRPSVLLIPFLLLAVPASGLVPVAQDDAGSGADAPNYRGSLTVAEGTVHEGDLLVHPIDASDWYAVDLPAWSTIRASISADHACLALANGLGHIQSGNACALLGEPASLEFTVGPPGRYYLVVGPGVASVPDHYAFAYAVEAPAPAVPTSSRVGSPFPAPPTALAGADPACGGAAPPTATSGEGDSGLVYAALKTGGRAVVAWTTEEATVASLTWNVSGGEDVTLSESSARRAHVFVLDGLPIGESLCFAHEGTAHAIRLANAMNAHDGTAYSLNLLVLANEVPQRAQLERGLDRYATLIRDATDGHVVSGRIVVVYADPDHHNSGWTTCFVALGGMPGAYPTCRLGPDVIFTADAFPAGAASTYRDGIEDREEAIWMNSYWQAGTVNLGDDVGSVLAHEMGHYAFGAMDLYVGSGCDVYAKSLSVMSSARNLTEFDDEINRCPNEAEIPGYVPTWTLLRERFPLVPDRNGVIDAGPTTAGGAYSLHTFEVLPLDVPSPPQDDAGSGGDAPDAPGGSLLVVPHARYVGTLPPGDAADHYAFHGLAGQTVNVTILSAPLCFVDIVDEHGVVAPDVCAISATGGLVHRAVLPHDGVWSIRVLTTPAYRFAFTLDERHLPGV